MEPPLEAPGSPPGEDTAAPRRSRRPRSQGRLPSAPTGLERALHRKGWAHLPDGGAMPGKKPLEGVSDKEERMYEHIKESAQESGRYGKRAKEVAARRGPRNAPGTPPRACGPRR